MRSRTCIFRTRRRACVSVYVIAECGEWYYENDARGRGGGFLCWRLSYSRVNSFLMIMRVCYRRPLPTSTDRSWFSVSRTRVCRAPRSVCGSFCLPVIRKIAEMYISSFILTRRPRDKVIITWLFRFVNVWMALFCDKIRNNRRWVVKCSWLCDVFEERNEFDINKSWVYSAITCLHISTGETKEMNMFQAINNALHLTLEKDKTAGK